MLPQPRKPLIRNDILALIFGIMSIIISFFVALVGEICAIAGTVLGWKTRQTSAIGKAGFICSLIGLGLNSFIWIFGAVRAAIRMSQGLL